MLGSLTHNEIDEVLQNNIVGRIGCGVGSKIYVVPINYVYDGKHILAHAMPGLKIDMMRTHPDVCFEVDQVQNVTNWKSVILWGTYDELLDERSRNEAIKALAEKMIHIKVSSSSLKENAHDSVRPVIFRIIIDEKTGRFERD
ncbi:MAG TPA: pyridoxamine 5'-phosphate oxidase family protein [Parafilimonas sp.]|nr:pyridoxamine 5'-phosphate oxidase family protein [Parafilimonas sp.]